jgi:hypothetical protein
MEHWSVNHDLGLNWIKRRYSFSYVAINDVSPHKAFCRQIIIIVIHRYFKNCASLPNVVPGAAAPTHAVASHDLGLNRRERWYSFINIAIDDVSPHMAFCRQIVVVMHCMAWQAMTLDSTGGRETEVL